MGRPKGSGNKPKPVDGEPEQESTQGESEGGHAREHEGGHESEHDG